MAVHAGLRRRQPGKARPLDRRVAIATVDFQHADVVLVAEGNRLFAHHPGIRAVRVAGQEQAGPQHERGRGQRTHQAQPGYDIRHPREDLGHNRDSIWFAGTVCAGIIVNWPANCRAPQRRGCRLAPSRNARLAERSRLATHDSRRTAKYRSSVARRHATCPQMHADPRIASVGRANRIPNVRASTSFSIAPRRTTGETPVKGSTPPCAQSAGS